MMDGGQGVTTPLAPAGYCRNRIYPLPSLPLPSAPNSCGRRLRQRWAERVKVTRAVNDKIDALNWLNSGAGERPSTPAHEVGTFRQGRRVYGDGVAGEGTLATFDDSTV